MQRLNAIIKKISDLSKAKNLNDTLTEQIRTLISEFEELSEKTYKKSNKTVRKTVTSKIEEFKTLISVFKTAYDPPVEFDVTTIDITKWETMATVNIPFPPKMKDNDFTLWLKSFENYFTLTQLEAEQKSRYFMLCIGDASSKIYSECDPHGLTYDELKVKCMELFEKSVNKKQLSETFFNLKQSSDSIRDYVYKLKSISKKLDIKETDQMFINKFINGLADTRIRVELLKEKGLDTFDKCFEQSLVLENIYAAEQTVNKVDKKQKKQFKQKDENSKNKKQNKKSKVEKNQCLYCRKIGHWKRDCYKFKNDEKQKANKDKGKTAQPGSSTACNVDDSSLALGNFHFN